MTDGRPGPRQSRSSGGRAGGKPRQGSGGSSRGSSEPRRVREDNDRRTPSEGRRSGGGPRSEKPAPEPGFGPFRGSQRDGAPGAPRRRRNDDEARAVRSVAEEAVARAAGEERPALRIVHGERRDGTPKGKAKAGGKGAGAKRVAPSGAPVAPRPRITRDAGRLQEALAKGARALDRGYEQEALRVLRPWREVHADSAELRELLGLTYYRLGKWPAAQKELEAFVELTGSVEQHPVLMDIARAMGKFKKVDQLWEELRAVSPAAEIVTEGRIVAAGALADQGRLGEAIKVLERAPGNPKRVLPHHIRLWYALADLQERAGDIPAARALFRKVSAQDPQFVDVAERLAALS